MAKLKAISRKRGDNVPASIDFNPNDPRLYNQVPMTREYSGIAPSDAVNLPKSPFSDVRAHTYINENGKQQSPSKTQVQESSSVQAPVVNRGEGTAKDKADWISYLNGPREGKPNTPNRLPAEISHSPAYDPGQRSGSEEYNGSE